MRLSSPQDSRGTMSNQKLAEAEQKARTAKRGLWADPKSMPPWEWRRLDKDEKANKKGVGGSSSSSGETTSQVGSQSKAAMSYWLSTNSNKRHNSGCRWYEKSKGHACTATEGVACKICGG